MEFKHGQPAKIVDAKQLVDMHYIGKYGRLYHSTIASVPDYIWVIGTSVQLPVTGLDCVVVELCSEAEILRNQDRLK